MLISTCGIGLRHLTKGFRNGRRTEMELLNVMCKARVMECG